MTAFSGSKLLLKIECDNDFKTLGGMKTNRFVLNNQLIDVTTKESGKWRELLNEGGMSSVSISGNGIYTSSESERILKDLAFSNQIHNYKLCFGNGDILQGKFQISSYERHGALNDEEQYSISLESAGMVNYNSYC